MNDAAGNASGFLLASLIYWVVIKILVLLLSLGHAQEGYQYGTTNPLGLMMIAFVVIKFLNTLHTGYEYRQKAYEQEMKMALKSANKTGSYTPPTGFCNFFFSVSSRLDRYSSGFSEAAMKFCLGYLTLFILRQLEFQWQYDELAHDRLRCANGFTAFTPNYPEVEDLHAIFVMSPVGKFGFAVLTMAVCVTKMASDKHDMLIRHSQKILMEELHEVVRRHKQASKVLAQAEQWEDEEENLIVKLQKLHADHDDLGEIAEEKDRHLVQLHSQHERRLHKVAGYLTQNMRDLNQHHGLIKARIQKNTYWHCFLDNQADFFGVICGLSMEGVCEATISYVASCSFLHDKDACAKAACNEETELTTAQRKLIVQFIAAFLITGLTVAWMWASTKIGMAKEVERPPEIDLSEDVAEEDEDAVATEYREEGDTSLNADINLVEGCYTCQSHFMDDAIFCRKCGTKRPSKKMAFAKEDANHDGVVDEEEAAAAHLMTMGIEAAGTVGAV